MKRYVCCYCEREVQECETTLYCANGPASSRYHNLCHQDHATKSVVVTLDYPDPAPAKLTAEEIRWRYGLLEDIRTLRQLLTDVDSDKTSYLRVVRLSREPKIFDISPRQPFYKRLLDLLRSEAARLEAEATGGGQ